MRKKTNHLLLLQGVKILENLAKKTGKKTQYWLIEDRDKRSLEALDQKLEHNIHIWGHKGTAAHLGPQKTPLFLQHGTLISTSFIGFFAWVAMFLF